jgi:hypothetical protein
MERVEGERERKENTKLLLWPKQRHFHGQSIKTSEKIKMPTVFYQSEKKLFPERLSIPLASNACLVKSKGVCLKNNLSELTHEMVGNK